MAEARLRRRALALSITASPIGFAGQPLPQSTPIARMPVGLRPNPAHPSRRIRAEWTSVRCQGHGVARAATIVSGREAGGCETCQIRRARPVGGWRLAASAERPTLHGTKATVRLHRLTMMMGALPSHCQGTHTHFVPMQTISDHASRILRKLRELPNRVGFTEAFAPLCAG